MKIHKFLLFVLKLYFRSKFSLFWISTVPLPGVTSMTVYDEAMTSMRVKWELVSGASGYLLHYNSINASVPSGKMEVSACRADAFQNSLQTISQNFHLCFIKPQGKVNSPLPAAPLA